MRCFKKIIEYGIYLLIFVLPFQTRLILREADIEYLSISLYAVDVLIFSLLIIFAIKIFLDPDLRRHSSNIRYPIMIIAGLDAALFISIFYSPDRILAFYNYLIFLEGVGVFFLFLFAKYDRVKLYISLAVSIVVQGAISAFQFFTQDSPAFKWLGMARHFPGEPGVSAIETIGPKGFGERWLRAYGSFDHPNILGAFLAIALIFIIYPIIKKKLKPKTWEFNLCLLAFYLGILGLVFSFSRSAWLAFVLAMTFLLVYFFLTKNWFAQLKILSLILISSFIFIFPFLCYNEVFVARLSAQGRLEKKSLDQRGEYLEEGRQVIAENPVFGIGLGNYIKYQRNKRPEAWSWTFEPVHNTFLLIMAEVGVAGFLFFLGLITWIAVESVSRGNFFNLSILLSLVIMMIFDHFWWSLHFGTIFLWIVLALLINNFKDKKT